MKNIIPSRVILFILLATIVGSVIFWLIKENMEKEARFKIAEKTFDVEDVTENDLIWGNPQAKLTIIEYSDLQCPACALYHRVINTTKRLVEKDIRIIYRHFPLMSIHPYAQLAAEYVEAAKFQQKHMEFIDVLFQNQKQWSKTLEPEKFFLAYAKKMGMDVQQLKKDKEKPEVLEKVKRDITSGHRANVAATPTFFLNKKKIKFPTDPQAFFQFVQKQKRILE